MSERAEQELIGPPAPGRLATGEQVAEQALYPLEKAAHCATFSSLPFGQSHTYVCLCLVGYAGVRGALWAKSP